MLVQELPTVEWMKMQREMLITGVMTERSVYPTRLLRLSVFSALVPTVIHYLSCGVCLDDYQCYIVYHCGTESDAHTCGW